MYKDYAKECADMLTNWSMLSILPSDMTFIHTPHHMYAGYMYVACMFMPNTQWSAPTA